MPDNTPNTEETFWARVERGDGCWLWSGRLNTYGYGVLRYRGRTIGAHRLSWIFTNGPIPEGLYVCHHCDNPRCVRPDHLFLGTSKDNQVDASRKGRSRGRVGHGEHNNHARLTADKIRLIFERRAQGATHKQIAQEFGICKTSVSYILRGIYWSSVSKPEVA